MSVYVFLGPSLPVDEARSLLDATYLPPVAMGDVYSLMHRQPKMIAIIDGLFDTSPAVWHKEILYALSQGVPVYGAASMGALRAAELHTYGMIGVGQIFRDFRDGILEDDDEVAVTHGPVESGHKALSDAMVNIREGLRRAELADVISSSTRSRLVEMAKKQFYPERFWPNLLRTGAALELPVAELNALERFLARERPDQKRADAIELLQHLAEVAAAGIPRHLPQFEFEPTTYWKDLIDKEVRTRVADHDLGKGLEVRQDVLRRHLRGVSQNRSELLRSTLFLCLVAEEMRRSNQYPQADRVDRHLQQLRAAQSADGVSSTEELHVLAEVEAFTEELITQREKALDRFLLLEVKRRGLYSDLVATVSAKWARLATMGLPAPTLLDAGVTESDLLEWYGKRFGIADFDPEKQAAELGFQTLEEFYRELLAELIVETKGFTRKEAFASA